MVIGDSSGRSSNEAIPETSRWLFRTIRTLRTYPLDNEMTLHAFAELVPRITQVLPLSLDLHADQIVTDGKVLLDERGTTPEIVTDLYRDGIRRIRLEAGLSEEELRRFLLVLATPLDPDNVTEDYVTRLWEAALPHVRISAIDPYLDAAISEDVLEGRPESVLAIDAEESEDDQAPSVPAEEAFAITVEEHARLSEAVRRTTGRPNWEAFAQATYDTLSTPLAEERLVEVVAILEASIHRLVQDVQWGIAVRILEQLRSQSSQHDHASGLALSRMADEERLMRLHQALEAGEGDPEEATLLLVVLAPESLPAICSFLERAQGERSGRAYLDALSRIGRPAIAGVVEGFRKGQGAARRWYARALAGLQGEAVVSVLINGLAETDDEVRREIVRALSRQDEHRATAALIRIAVADPDATTRIVALRGLAGARTRGDCGELAGRIESRQYGTLSNEEKDLLFRAIGTVGDEATVALLRRILRRNWIPGLERRDDWPRAAAALARVATHSARQALQALSGHRHAGLATVCADALRASRRQNE